MQSCNIGGLFVNLLAYADDMVLLSPPWSALQALIKLLELCAPNLISYVTLKKLFAGFSSQRVEISISQMIFLVLL